MKYLIFIVFCTLLSSKASASCGIGPMYDSMKDQAVLNQTIAIIANRVGYSLVEAQVKLNNLEAKHYSPDISHLDPSELTGASDCPVADYKISLSLSGKTWLYNSINQGMDDLFFMMDPENKATINAQPFSEFVETVYQQAEAIYENTTLTNEAKYEAIDKFYQTQFRCDLEITAEISTNPYTEMGELFSYGYLGRVPKFELICNPL